ncbi:MAG: GNAT family N-acetyltransferase, partial [Schaedlerella arabinosiphila]|nr:GNAT family N-acetyltransferase [Schaedlerella arabinosiphila]
MITILKLREHEELAEKSAQWFHQKWGVPLEAYIESIDECLCQKAAVPQWYLALEGHTVVGG